MCNSCVYTVPYEELPRFLCAVQLEGTTVDSFNWGKLSLSDNAYTLTHCQCYRSEVDLYSMNNLGAMWWCSVDHNEKMPGTMIVCILHVGYIFDSHQQSCLVIVCTVIKGTMMQLWIFFEETDMHPTFMFVFCSGHMF